MSGTYDSNGKSSSSGVDHADQAEQMHIKRNKCRSNGSYMKDAEHAGNMHINKKKQLL